MTLLKTQTDIRGVTTITFDRADAANAMNREFINQFTLALNNLSSNTRVLVIAGNGNHFSAGADINWMKQSLTLSDEQNQEDAMALSDMLDTLDRFPSPTIARVHGGALGGGTGVASCCDIVVAAENAKFAFTEVRLGLIPAVISPYAVAAIGTRAARRYFLTGEQIDAVEAYRLGLVHDVCSTDNLDNRVEEKITALLACGRHAQASAKQLITEYKMPRIDSDFRIALAERLAAIRTGKEAQEGLTAFIEKRAPDWPVS